MNRRWPSGANIEDRRGFLEPWFANILSDSMRPVPISRMEPVRSSLKHSLPGDHIQSPLGDRIQFLLGNQSLFGDLSGLFDALGRNERPPICSVDSRQTSFLSL